RRAAGWTRQVHGGRDRTYDAWGQDHLRGCAEARRISVPARIRSAPCRHAAAAAGPAARARSRDRSVFLRDHALIETDLSQGRRSAIASTSNETASATRTVPPGPPR